MGEDRAALYSLCTNKSIKGDNKGYKPITKRRGQSNPRLSYTDKESVHSR